MLTFCMTAGLLMLLPGGKSVAGHSDKARLCCGEVTAFNFLDPGGSSPCPAAIAVALGEVDERFQLTREELKREILEAARFWSEAAGQPVVVYDEGGGLPVHFVYEDQQELTDQERDARLRIQRIHAEVEKLEKELRTKERRYQQEVEAYETESAVLENRIQHLNQWVRKINEKGGFNESELRQFHYRKQGVDRVAEQLEKSQELLHESGSDISRLVADINRRIEEKNRLIDDYNLRFSGVHHLTQGVYEWNANDRAIHIYQFAGPMELRFVLTHEIGHALGMDHVGDPTSVMYHTIGEQQGRQIRLTDADRRALRQVCTP